MKKKLLFGFFILIFLFAGKEFQHACETNPVSGTMDWRPQDYPGNLGITAVRYDDTLDCLVLDCALKGGDDQMSKGEILLDLKYVPCLEANVPVDMTGRMITVEIDIPQFIAKIKEGDFEGAIRKLWEKNSLPLMMGPAINFGKKATKRQ